MTVRETSPLLTASLSSGGFVDAAAEYVETQQRFHLQFFTASTNPKIGNGWIEFYDLVAVKFSNNLVVGYSAFRDYRRQM